jgi:hypothetical protein
MRTHARLFAVVVLCVAVGGCAAKSSATTAEASQELHRAGEARAAAAQSMLHALEQRYRANDPLTPDFLEQLATWSRRSMEATVAISDTRPQRIAAVEEHLARSREWLDVVRRRRDGPSDWVLAAQRYHVASAEYRLAEIKSGG